MIRADGSPDLPLKSVIGVTALVAMFLTPFMAGGNVVTVEVYSIHPGRYRADWTWGTRQFRPLNATGWIGVLMIFVFMAGLLGFVAVLEGGYYILAGLFMILLTLFVIGLGSWHLCRVYLGAIAPHFIGDPPLSKVDSDRGVSLWLPVFVWTLCMAASLGVIALTFVWNGHSLPLPIGLALLSLGATFFLVAWFRRMVTSWRTLPQ